MQIVVVLSKGGELLVAEEVVHVLLVALANDHEVVRKVAGGFVTGLQISFEITAMTANDVSKLGYGHELLQDRLQAIGLDLAAVGVIIFVIIVIVFGINVVISISIVGKLVIYLLIVVVKGSKPVRINKLVDLRIVSSNYGFQFQ